MTRSTAGNNVTKLRDITSLDADHASNLATAIAALGATECDLWVGNDVTVSANATIPSTMGLRPLKGAIITINTGITLTINGPVEAGHYQIFKPLDAAGKTTGEAGFDLTTAGVVVFGITSEVKSDWWPNWVTNCGGALSAAFASIANVGGKVKMPGGSVDSTIAVNMTGLSSNFFELAGVSGSTYLRFAVATMCFDCTGSNRITFRDFRYAGDAVTTPRVGIFLCRDTPGLNSLFHRFYNIVSQGSFSNAPLYSYAAEECRYHDCQFQNGANNSASFWSTNDNDGTGEDVTSVYSAATQATGNQSNSDNQFFGCNLRHTGTGNADNMHLRGAINMHWYGTFFVNGGTLPRAHVYIDSDGETTAFCSINGYRMETGTNVRYGFLIAGATTVSNFTVRDGYIGASTNVLYSQFAKLSGWTWDNNNNTVGGACDFDALDIEYSYIREFGPFDVNGTLTGGMLICDSSQTTINAQSFANIQYLDTGMNEINGPMRIRPASVNVGAAGAVAITGAHSFGAVAVVTGAEAGNIFADTVFFSDATATVLVAGGHVVSGAPQNRTYTAVGGVLKLQMDANTYAVRAGVTTVY